MHLRRISAYPGWMAAVVALAAVAAGEAVSAAGQAQDAAKSGETVTFSEEFLADQTQIDTGKELWGKQCRHCHGKSAYPGKAPKLKPKRYTPSFVYDRLTYGFRKMPAWEQVYTLEERRAIVAYIMSRQFSP